MSAFKVVVAAGCPGTDWGSVLPILTKAGLSDRSKEIAEWCDRYSPENPSLDGENEDWDPDRVVPGDKILHSILSRRTCNSPILLAVHRNLPVLDSFAHNCPSALFLLFYRDAEDAFAHALHSNDDPAGFLNNWKKTSRQLIRFHIQNRHQSCLLNVKSVIEQPESLIKALDEIGIPTTIPAKIDFPDVNISVVDRIVARFQVERAPELSQLTEELEARALPLAKKIPNSGNETGELIQKYIEYMRAEREKRMFIESAEGKIRTIEHSRDSLLVDLKRKTKDFANAMEENKTLHSVIDALQKEKSEVEKQCQAAAIIKDELSEKNKLMLEQLATVYKELENCNFEKTNIARSLEEKTRTCAKLTKSIAEIQQSAIWRLCSPAIKALRKTKHVAAMRRDADLLRSSELFDDQWYLSNYSDVAKSGMDPVKHYLLFGAGEGRNPSPDFSTAFYVKSNPDVAEMGINPLVHFIKFGKDQGKSPSPS